MGCLSFQDFSTLAKTRQLYFVELPELGENNYVNLRPLSAGQLIELQKQYGQVEEKDTTLFSLSLLRYCIVNDEGQQVFATDKEVKVLLEHSPQLLTKLGEKAVEISGIGQAKKN